MCHHRRQHQQLQHQQPQQVRQGPVDGQLLPHSHRHHHLLEPVQQPPMQQQLQQMPRLKAQTRPKKDASAGERWAAISVY